MNFNTGFVNCHGFSRKKPLLENLCFSQNLHMLGVAETWTNTQHKVSLPGYTALRRDRPTPPGQSPRGGVALFFHPHIPATQITPPIQFRHLEIILCSILCPLGPVLIVVLYLPPTSRLADLLEFFEYLITFPNFLLMGDLNSRHTSFGDNCSNPNGIFLADLIIDLPIYRCQNINPTFIGPMGSSIPDHFIVSERLSGRIGDIVIGPSIASDHLPIYLSGDILPPPPSRERYKIIKDFNLADWDLYRTTITQLLPETPDTTTCVALCNYADNLVAILKQAAAIAIPVKTVDTYRPSLPRDIVDLIRQKRKLYNQYKTNRDPTKKTEWNRLSAIVRRKIIVFRELQWTAVCESLNYKDGSKFWHKFQRLTGQKSRKISPLVINGHVFSLPDDKAREFASSLETIHRFPTDPHFDNNFCAKIERLLSRHEPYLSSHEPIPTQDISYPELVDVITPAEVSAAIYKGRNSSPGEDGITRLMLRQAPPQFITHLSSLFTGCLILGYIPPHLKSATVVMIEKKNQPPEQITSYRPISLLNVVGKILERVIQSRLTSFAETNNVIPESQAGFRAGRSTTDPLIRLITEVSSALNEGKCVLAAFLDISRAFDRVWHNGLCFKLLKLKIPLTMVRFIKAFLSERCARVKIQDHFSRPISPAAGVPQGSCLSPLLYLLYCYDIPNPLNKRLFLALFADDTAYWCVGRTAREVFRNLQRQITALETWMRRWRILPNAQKTQLILFRHRSKTRKSSQDNRHRSIILWNEAVFAKRTVKYLGITFSDIMNWRAHCRDVICRARIRMNLLVRLRGRLKGCDFCTLRFTYKAFIRPLFEYAAPALYPVLGSASNGYMSLERRILRRIARLHPWTENDLVYSTTGMEKLDIRLARLCETYGQRLRINEREDLINLLSTPRAPPRKPKYKYNLPLILLTP